MVQIVGISDGDYITTTRHETLPYKVSWLFDIQLFQLFTKHSGLCQRISAGWEGKVLPGVQNKKEDIEEDPRETCRCQQSSFEGWAIGGVVEEDRSFGGDNDESSDLLGT